MNGGDIALVAIGYVSVAMAIGLWIYTDIVWKSLWHLNQGSLQEMMSITKTMGLVNDDIQSQEYRDASPEKRSLITWFFYKLAEDWDDVVYDLDCRRKKYQEVARVGVIGCSALYVIGMSLVTIGSMGVVS